MKDDVFSVPEIIMINERLYILSQLATKQFYSQEIWLGFLESDCSQTFVSVSLKHVKE